MGPISGASGVDRMDTVDSNGSHRGCRRKRVNVSISKGTNKPNARRYLSQHRQVAEPPSQLFLADRLLVSCAPLAGPSFFLVYE
jgi:hypothetical protein